MSTITTESAIQTHEVPEWLTETPEHRQTEYQLVMTDAGEWEQSVPMNREEYEWLKARLAERRGVSASNAADPAANLGAAAKSATEQKMASLAKDICWLVDYQVEAAFRDRQIQPSDTAQTFAELALLADIVRDWDSRARGGLEPDGELPLIAAIHYILGR